MHVVHIYTLFINVEVNMYMYKFILSFVAIYVHEMQVLISQIYCDLDVKMYSRCRAVQLLYSSMLISTQA